MAMIMTIENNPLGTEKNNLYEMVKVLNTIVLLM